MVIIWRNVSHLVLGRFFSTHISIQAFYRLPFSSYYKKILTDEIVTYYLN